MGDSWLRGSLLGAGSFGTVSLGVSRVDGTLFAVKSVELVDGGGALAALEQEASILSSISSPYVVGYLGGDVTVGDAAKGQTAMRNLFLEYMPGGSVVDLMAKLGGRLDEQLARAYARGILLALNFLHSSGIVHCDVKGRNVLVGGPSGVKLGDLGSARRISDGGAAAPAASLRGTPLWMAPEVARGEEQGFASDIWSLGCTLVEMLTGRAPWDCPARGGGGGGGAAALAAMYKIGCSDEVPETPSGLSIEGKDFLSRCFQRDAAKRASAAELLEHPFVAPRPPPGTAGCPVPPPPLSPRSPLELSRWVSSSSASSSTSSSSASSSTSASSASSSTSSSTAEHFDSSRRWIVVHSPRRASGSEGLFDRLSDFDPIQESEWPSSPPAASASAEQARDDDNISAPASGPLHSLDNADGLRLVMETGGPFGVLNNLVEHDKTIESKLVACHVYTVKEPLDMLLAFGVVPSRTSMPETSQREDRQHQQHQHLPRFCPRSFLSSSTFVSKSSMGHLLSRFGAKEQLGVGWRRCCLWYFV